MAASDRALLSATHSLLALSDKAAAAVEEARAHLSRADSALANGTTPSLEIPMERMREAARAVQSLRAEVWRLGSASMHSALDTVEPTGLGGGPVPRVAVVDDDPSVRACIREVLVGYDLVEFTDGTDAIAAITAGNRFDAVLCDIVMSGATGVEVYNHVCHQRPALARRFVLITAGEFSELMRELLDDMDQTVLVLHKPLEPKMVRWIVDQQTGGVP